jgi:hypothetical protein
MAIQIPNDVRALIAERRERDEHDRQSERKGRRAALRAEAEVQRRKWPLARRLLEFARTLAAEQLPTKGVEILITSTGRSTTRTVVRPDGAIETRHIAAFIGGLRVFRRERDLLDLPHAELERLVSVIETGEVWAQIRQSLHQSQQR